MRTLIVFLILTLLVLSACRNLRQDEIQVFGTEPFGTVILLPDPDADMIAATLILSVGAAEDGGREGIAHFAEHRAFSGAVEATEYRGAMEAHTTLQSTVFQTYAAASDLPVVLTFLTAVMSDDGPSNYGFEIERGRILAEIAAAEDAPIARSVLCAARVEIFTAAPWNDCVLGEVDVIETVREAEVEAFQRAFYRSDRATLMVTGPFDRNDVMAILPSTGDARRAGADLAAPMFAPNTGIGTGTDDAVRTLVAYRAFKFPPSLDDVSQEAALGILSVWDLEALRERLTSALHHDGFLVRTFALDVETLGKDHGFVSLVLEIERGQSAQDVTEAVRAALGEVRLDIPDGGALDMRRTELSKASDSPPAFWHVLLRAAQSRRDTFESDAYQAALAKVPNATVLGLRSHVLDPDGWQFVSPATQ